MLGIRRESGRPVSTADTTRGSSHPVEVRSTLSPGGRRESESRIYSGVGPTSGDTDETTLAYSYGGDGTLTRIDSAGLVGDGEISVTADPTTGWTYSTSAPGIRAVYQYDSAGRISDRTTTLGTGPGVLTISSPTSYDAAGNVKTQGSWAYDYDKLGRLTRATDSATGEVLEYRYDAASNRIEVKRNGDVTQALSFGAANEIDTATHPEYVYDELGRLISDTTSGGDRRHYIWDGASRLIGMDLYLQETGHFRNLRMSYDASGRLVQRDTYLDLTYLGERLTYHYDGDRLIAELDGTGVLREYLYAGGEAPAAMRARQSDGSYQNYFFVTNTHGDVVAVTDKDGNIVNRYAYGPWGEATKLAEEVHQPFRYAGYRYEDGFDLYYLRARWYDAGTGRFLSRDGWRGDPARLLSTNRYSYSESNPTSLVDPTGWSPLAAVASRRASSAVSPYPRPSGRPCVQTVLTFEVYCSVIEMFESYFGNLTGVFGFLDPYRHSVDYIFAASRSALRQIWLEARNDETRYGADYLSDHSCASFELMAAYEPSWFWWATKVRHSITSELESPNPGFVGVARAILNRPSGGSGDAGTC